MLTVKRNQLLNFIKSYENIPQQGRPGWEESRGIIGGSTFQKMVKKTTRKSKNNNYYGPCRSVLLSLFKRFTGRNAAMNWGHVFEHMTTNLTANLLHTETYETGSIPGLIADDGTVIQSYSPDALLVCMIQHVIDLLNHENNRGQFDSNIINQIRAIGECAIVLLEIKNPQVRDIPPNIPPEYKKQPLVGMATIPIIDFSLFINTMYRKCSIKQFDFSADYDKIYHLDNYDDIPAFMGYIGVYEITDETAETKIDADLLQEPVQKILFLIEKEFQKSDSLYHDKMTGFMDYVILCQKIWHEYQINISLMHKVKIIKRVLRHYNIQPPGSLIIGQNLLKILSVTEEITKLDELLLTNKIVDFGEYNKVNFDNLLNKIVTDRKLDTGYRCYYPNMITSGNARKWLTEQIAEFVNYCRDNTYKPIGIIPCKLMRFAVIPIMPKNNFIQKHYDNIKKIADFAIRVRKLLAQEPDPEMHDVIIDLEINKYMNPDYEPIDELDIEYNNVGAFNFEKINDELLDL